MRHLVPASVPLQCSDRPLDRFTRLPRAVTDNSIGLRRRSSHRDLSPAHPRPAFTNLTYTPHQHAKSADGLRRLLRNSTNRRMSDVRPFDFSIGLYESGSTMLCENPVRFGPA